MQNERKHFDLISDAIYRQAHATARSLCSAAFENKSSKISHFETELHLLRAKIKVAITLDYE